MAKLGFPDGFVWGAATSAQQVEGGRGEGARGESIWDRFAAEPGRIADGSNADVACDHFHRWREDVALMRGLGLNAYRFSIAWPRILPQGTGAVNRTGLDFYDALVDELLEAHIEPFPTLYHWDLPQALQDRGGWASRDTVEAFVDYAATVVDRLGDRVRKWVTHNEPWCITTLGHEEGHHAPGHQDPPEALWVAHHLMLSHGRAAEAIRARRPGSEVGIVLMHVPIHTASESEADREAARWMDGFFNRWYLDPLFRGSYPQDALADKAAAGHLEGAEHPAIRDGDLAAISVPMDFLGVNYYSRLVVQAGPDGQPAAVAQVPADQLTDMGWEVYPEGLGEVLERLHREYAPPAIYITENGAAYDDPIGADGRIRDGRRIAYLHRHLVQAHRAIEEDIPLRGYFAWSLLDNFEWAHGYEKKFGLHAIDPESRDRIAKDSAEWYRGVVTTNAVDDGATAETRGASRVSTT